jgi:Cdc6-like AAA superfamily ATPase
MGYSYDRRTASGDSTANARTMLDQLLDRVKPGQHELTIDTTGYTRAQVDQIIAAAKARGLHPAASPNSVLIRDLSKMHL